ncbi:uncharacterized protein UV8b_01530 [Ustilaginoidea virens]|uniref:Sulphur transport domain-containing protein n=2 Tax=Ustilaginoidea virens TaxID=1159556 RepID=A0A8E5HKV9_USTVR|nr:uncharacterized protein UV8b_01530 [Ustilaginoidea virens]QUC17289.1 hypothetical protein UV8b_01530 [Ustilaginoidea virens]
MAASVLSGAAFGAAMAAAGFHEPSVVVSQLRFENWHMMQAFLTATATSAAICALAKRLGLLDAAPRSSSPLGLFSPYDGNIIGGALLGAGMALAGSCPGTLYAQLAGGARSGLLALAGAAAGGMLWSGVGAKAVARLRDRRGVRPLPGTVSDRLGVTDAAALLLLEGACAVAVAATALRTPAGPGARGGLLIGGAQLVSVLARGSLVGVSASFEEAGGLACRLLGGAAAPAASYAGVAFASGVAAGAWALLQLAPGLAAAAADAAQRAQVPPAQVSPALALAGGLLMAVGSRLAGGCTSGHGISGISLLSTSSVVTIATTFAVGAVVAPMAY